ncbi:phosphoribosylanthranilate isomerase [Microvirga puerhi]|uniref:N-(5'-phosphoribosyl)anthranilate isomerase n=1 Tax=Microvirga puerhi TaxID=2876078 RepID=A0ABS7VPM1_9HYPH|nr:phosphoribosylanthranilate isomerase [Microvirga puerhi]MBZ6077494.1 phosphoribosylanthranilate isomerase [Microvirga puerhi]
MDGLIKICGISTPETLDVALSAGADFIGFARFPKSPRHVGLDQARALSRQAAGRAQRVVLLVDADDAAIAEAVEAIDPEFLQLHGHETEDRIREIRDRFGRQIIKALGIAEEADLAGIASYGALSDLLLLDAKPPRTSGALPGGNGLPFDWRLLTKLDPDTAFMLSGGLTSDNVAEAIRLTGAKAVDVSSGVESAPGIKDPARIEAFIKAARAAYAAKGQ